MTQFDAAGHARGRPWARIAHRTRAVFAADTRSLAVARMGVGVTLLVDLAWRATDLGAFYSDDGILPRAALLERFARDWSLHVWSGSATAAAILFSVHALAALALVAGLRTRLATIACWLLTASLHARNPVLLQGGDALLVLLLFWGMLTPWGLRWSVDAALDGARPPARVLCAGTVGLSLQMPLVYLAAALEKRGPEWRSSLGAVYYALNDDSLASRFGTLLGSAPTGLLALLTALTVVVEVAIAVLLLAPVRTRVARLLAIGLGAALQAGFACCFHIGLFPLVSTVALLPFVPGSVWRRVEGWGGFERLRAVAAAGSARLGRFVSRASPRPRLWPLEAAGVLAIALVLWSNAAALAAAPMPRTVRRLVATLHLTQGWKMFAKPHRVHRWYVAVATGRDGRRVDLLRGAPLRWDKPENVAESFRSYRWRKYLDNVREDDMTVQHSALARYLCRAWNRAHDPSERVRTVRLYYLTEPIGRPDLARRRSLVFEEPCGARPRGERPSLARAGETGDPLLL
jgi:hypothetical protein